MRSTSLSRSWTGSVRSATSSNQPGELEAYLERKKGEGKHKEGDRKTKEEGKGENNGEVTKGKAGAKGKAGVPVKEREYLAKLTDLLQVYRAYETIQADGKPARLR